MKIEEYLQYDGIGLAELVAAGEVTPEELRRCATEQLDHWDPQLNVLTRRLDEWADEALAAGLPEGPFRGVPTLLKESLGLEGIPFTLASVMLKDNISATTHTIVERMRQTGALFLGHTNMSEFGLLPNTESALYGAAYNPWNQAYSTGGSSGGAAAAVAAGIVPFAAGGDGGGSIRIPASICGVFGLKPSRGRNPNELNAPPDGFVSYHILSRSVRDTAIMLDETHGAQPGERWWLPPPEERYADVISRQPEPLRIAFSTVDYTGRKADPPCRKAVETMASWCEGLGHHVEERHLDVDGSEFNEAFKVIWTQVAGHVLKEAQRLLAGHPKVPGVLRRLSQRRGLLFWLTGAYKRDGLPLMEPFTRMCARVEARYTPADHWHAWNLMRQTEAATVRFLTQDVDLYLTPVLGSPPAKIGAYRQSWGEAQAEAYLMKYAGFTPIANACGFPAMSVPTLWTDEDLPIGSHFLAAHGREDLLLQLAAQLEDAHPWMHHYQRIKRG